MSRSCASYLYCTSTQISSTSEELALQKKAVHDIAINSCHGAGAGGIKFAQATLNLLLVKS